MVSLFQRRLLGRGNVQYAKSFFEMVTEAPRFHHGSVIHFADLSSRIVRLPAFEQFPLSLFLVETL